MYETEANSRTASAAEIPADVLAQFQRSQEQILLRTVLPWGEHCTECVWPTCYTSCELYEPREDGRCRRFAEGMVRVDCPELANGYLLKISFKRWGKLWSPANIHMRRIDAASAIERRDERIGSALVQLPVPTSLRTKAIHKRYGWKKRLAQRATPTADAPTSFVIECYNPNPESIALSLTMRPTSPDKPIPYQNLVQITPGFHRVRIPVTEIEAVLDVKSPFSIDLIPNSEARLTTLYFGLVDFVTEKPVQKPAESPSGKPGKIKCVVWDLDNTLWSGILVEDGPDKLVLKTGIADIIKALDDRGILNSIASKNNHDEAVEVLKRFGVHEYFLYPQISWGPKSIGVKKIAEKLNIGIDTLLFVDDSAFELAEVKESVAGIRTMDAAQYTSLLGLPECQVPVTAESSGRRKMYQVESERQDLAQSFGNDYFAFLRHCNIRINLYPLTESNLERVHELTQRTNQMNFSGNRYDRSVLQEVIKNPNLDTYVIDCEDRFGSYGIVGFSIVDTTNDPLMTDLMFSCRVQSKRVEHAFLSYVIRKYITQTGRDFYANYRKTPRNAPSGKVFADIGMQDVKVNQGTTLLVFPHSLQVPADGVIELVERDQSVCTAQ